MPFATAVTVVGRGHTIDVRECPERGPDLEEVFREPAGAFVAWRFAAVFTQDRLELVT